MEKTIYQKLATTRLAVQKKCTKKSGLNEYAKFNYFELKDFLPTATAELAKEGLVAIFNIEMEPLVIEMDDNAPTVSYYEVANLMITDGKEGIVFQTPTAEAGVKGATPIQNLGSQHTYLKRYLYLNALELSEADTVDAQEQDKPKTNQRPATEKQKETLKKMGIPFKEDITMESASAMIKEQLNGTRKV